MRFWLLGQYLTQLFAFKFKVKGQFSPNLRFSTLRTNIASTMRYSRRHIPTDIKLSPACSPFNSKQNRMLLQFIDGVFVTLASQKGIASHSSSKSPEGKLGQWRSFTSDSVKRHYKHVYAKRIATYSVSGPYETPKTAKLATIGRHWVGQGQ